jgi:hypothetical protein
MRQTVCSSWKDNIERHQLVLWKPQSLFNLFVATETLRALWQQKTAFRGAWVWYVEGRARRT